MQTVVVDHDFAIPVDRVFAYMVDHDNIGDVVGAKIRVLEPGADGTRNGVGSRRELKMGPLPAFEETVTEVVENSLIRYRITKGSPLRDHEGVMRFTPTESGSHLHYEITFGTAVPGLDVVLKHVLQRGIAKGMSKAEAGA